MKRYRISFFGLLLIFALSNNITYAQEGKGTTIDSLETVFLNWYNADLSTEKILGVSVDKAYQELLVGKEARKTIVVAVIDGGVDVNHEDLQGKIWTNPDEIPGNQIDDDGNGYVDDIHGWNFLGNAQGENINDENYEFVRILRELKPKFDSVPIESIAPSDTQEYSLYNKCLASYDEKMKETESQLKNLKNFKENLKKAGEVLFSLTNSNEPSYEQIKQIKPLSSKQKAAKKLFTLIYKQGFDYKFLDEALEHFTKSAEVSLNLELNARKIIGDNLSDIQDSNYGNNDVIGERADHGTFVSGLIAANRGNDMGIDGIASQVKIMALRAVPDGDEYDKDIALSIRYAVDNGANIINMSFGKDFSPEKTLVDDAILYAQDHGVLLVHAAGNESTDNDAIVHNPVKVLNTGNAIENWITVGANSWHRNKFMAAGFSNYGQTSVDLFAPGADIISLAPGSTYDLASGTSFSCPVVSGVAALVWSYYPELTVAELKTVLLASAQPDKKKVLLPNQSYSKNKKIRFNELSVTGGIINAYRALELAEEKAGK